MMAMMGGQNEPVTVFEFNQLQQDQHMIVNDSVMGGRSQSQLLMLEKAVNFNGTVSLDNNGGFASIRMIWPFLYDAELLEPEMLRLKVRGDGLRYQFRLRTNRGFDGAAYSYSFDTIENQEQTVYIPIDQFIPTFRGRQLSDMPKLRFADVQQMGVLVADKQVGSFSIDLIQLSLQ